MNKKIYQVPEIKIVMFKALDVTNVDLRSAQQITTPKSVAELDDYNVIDF